MCVYVIATNIQKKSFGQYRWQDYPQKKIYVKYFFSFSCLCVLLLLHLCVHLNNNRETIYVKVKTTKNKEIKMNSKTHRLSIIRKIIRSEYISSQEELIARLEECGLKVTQSTLSRDLKFMHVAKVPHKEKGYVYMLPNATHATEIVVSQNITDNITDIAFSGNMCVITTKPGYASAITVPIDSRGIPEILGTIAGDNVILLILREGYNHDSLMEQLCSLFPSLRHL